MAEMGQHEPTVCCGASGSSAPKATFADRAPRKHSRIIWLQLDPTNRVIDPSPQVSEGET